MIDLVLRTYQKPLVSSDSLVSLAETNASSSSPLVLRSFGCRPPLARVAVQKDKGGDPEIVRESQRKRGASVELVDDVLARYTAWTKRECDRVWDG